MHEHESALLAVSVAARRLDLDIRETPLRQLASERVIDTDGIAGATARVGTYGNRQAIGGPGSEKLFLESIEARKGA